MAKKTISKSKVGYISKDETIKTTWRELVAAEKTFCEYKSTVIREGHTPRKVRITVILTVEDVK